MRGAAVVFVQASLVALAACIKGGAADDAFARRFIEELRTRDPAGAAHLEPNGELARMGWDSLATATSEILPTGPVDSVRLVEWGATDSLEMHVRRLSYRIFQGDRVATATIFITRRNGRLYANTVKAGPLRRIEDAPSIFGR